MDENLSEKVINEGLKIFNQCLELIDQSGKRFSFEIQSKVLSSEEKGSRTNTMTL